MKTINTIILAIVLLAMSIFPQNVSAVNQVGSPQQQSSSILVWENKPDMPTARYNMGAAVSEGKIYLIGGDNFSCTPLTNVDEYDPTTETWNTRTSMPTGRWGLGVATAPDGKIYAMGGGGGECGSVILDTVEVYDPINDSWETRTSMPTPRMDLSLATATNGKIYAMGGRDFNNSFATVEEYDPATDTWTTKNDMPWPNAHSAVTAANNGKIYLLGGDDYIDVLLEYDPATDSWVTRASIPTPRFNMRMAQASDGRIYVVGGGIGGGYITSVEVYDPASDAWGTDSNITVARITHVLAAIGDQLYAIGGWGPSGGPDGGPLSSVEAGTIVPVTPPVNDNFADATIINTLPFNDTADITEATIEANEPQNCDYSTKTVWYVFTPTTNAVVRADMSGSSFWYTILNAYQAVGPGFDGLSHLQCGRFYNASVTFSVQAGETYYLQAGSTYYGGGELHLNVQEIPPPENDDFANATMIPSSLPFYDNIDASAATTQADEPTSSCASYGPNMTVLYTFTPDTSGSISASIPNKSFYPTFAAYTGSSLTNLSEVGCRNGDDRLTFHVDAGTTYYFQVGKYYAWQQGGSMQFLLDIAPQPVAGFYFYPYDPSVFDTVQFYNQSYDPGMVDFQSLAWDFGDGTTSTTWYPTHKYSADGDYTVQLTVTTYDGRTASITQTIQVRTHDVAIVKIAAPNSASSGQTRKITVTLRNKKYPETVTVDLYKSVQGGEVWVNSITLQVPVSSGNRTTSLSFNYTFTSQDVQVGKVSFRVVATISGARDAYPSDNEGISSPPTKVNK